jgi:hypothetical protein
MNISFLKLKNCLGIKELEFKPGQITLIEGAEQTGKTSVLESIQRFFGGKPERSDNFVYSEDGTTADRAETFIDMDDGTKMKKYYSKDGKITTSSVVKNGMSPNNTEAYLKGIIGERQLNPISLIHMEPKDLSTLILSFIPIKVTADDLKEWGYEPNPFIDYNKHGLQVCKDVEKAYYDKRTTVNARIKDLTGEIKGDKEKIPKNYDPEAWRNVSLSEKYDAIKAANKVNEDRQVHQVKVDSKEAALEGLRNQAKIAIADVKQESAENKKDTENLITELKRQITVLENELSQADAVCTEKVKTTTAHYKGLADAVEKNAEESTKYLAEHPVIAIEPLETAHTEAEEMKSYIRSADDLKVKEKELADKEIESQKLTEKIEYMRTKPQMLLAKAEIPIKGITVDGQGNVLVYGRPPINLSGGERIRFAVNAARETANPDFKLILINGLEALSPAGQKEFIEECTGDGYRYIMTKVADGALKITVIDESGRAVDAETGEVI